MASWLGDPDAAVMMISVITKVVCVCVCVCVCVMCIWSSDMTGQFVIWSFIWESLDCVWILHWCVWTDDSIHQFSGVWLVALEVLLCVYFRLVRPMPFGEMLIIWTEERVAIDGWTVPRPMCTCVWCYSVPVLCVVRCCSRWNIAWSRRTQSIQSLAVAVKWRMFSTGWNRSSWRSSHPHPALVLVTFTLLPWKVQCHPLMMMSRSEGVRG